MTVVPAIFVVPLMAGLAGDVVRDRFNDNNIDTGLWRVRNRGAVTLAETNRRLEFSADGSTDDSYALLEVKDWGAAWSEDFEVELDFRLNVKNLGNEEDVVLAIALAFQGRVPDRFTGYSAAIHREGNVTTLFLDRLRRGNDVESDEVVISATRGKLTLEYDRSDDRLEARIGNASVHLDGVWDRFGEEYGDQPLVIAIGCVTGDGFIEFPGRRVHLDEFKFSGATIPR